VPSEIASSVICATTIKLSRAAFSVHSRIWSAIDSFDWFSVLNLA